MSYHPYDPRMAYDPGRKLTDGDVQDLKPEGWWGDDGKLYRDFTFDTYGAGVDFVVRVAALAEAQGHHPDIRLSYRRVRVSYFTYDAGGVTSLDIEGARAVNDLLAEAGQP
ncbi:4a-hydroxytetrahydrobiopterin dehydratase [Deinococcus aetherius]|uniref:4a-hydroxytetrahydrobiopterin dehydratase n=1 Tax=Deinococcus aetherius TaxID=200252 RepID=A0ABM8ABR1_9DEIO|nr:4a-hydroxytetrahydrobiopterin dehydratase [Deinococcus aetherius]BDP41170.1 4a-hydroxytetrahydrobiopterin dehydratase [Deinococcus aetherius]